MLYRHKPTWVKAFTFDELAQLGRDQCVPCYGPHNLPWSFTFAGCPVTHENDDCYLITAKGSTLYFYRGDMLISSEFGEIYRCSKEDFDRLYEPAE